MDEQQVVRVMKNIDHIRRFSLWNFSRGNKKHIRTLKKLLPPQKQIDMIREKNVQLILGERLY